MGLMVHDIDKYDEGYPIWVPLIVLATAMLREVHKISTIHRYST